MSMSISIDRLLNASPERLYEVWTNQEHLSQWFGVKVQAEPKIGGPISFHFGEASGPVVGKFVALEPYRYVAFTWTNYCGDGGPETTVHVTFDKEGAKSRLTLRHEGFATQKSFDSHDEGWLNYMELWAARTNSGPADAPKASISETFPKSINVQDALAGWLGKTQIDVSELADGLRVVKSENVEARLMPCRFGTSLAVAEWGFKTEDERLAARQKWRDKFATLK